MVDDSKTSLPALPDLRAAATIIYQAMQATPQYCWPLLCERIGAEVWVKHENHTPIGSFKLRGGLVYLDWLLQQGRPAGVICATRGNHGQSVAFAARRHDVPCAIVVPLGNSREKNAAMRSLGADLIEHGADFSAAAAHAARLAEDRGLHLVPSFHPLLVRGVGSYAVEFFEQAPPLDVVYVPIGLGSGICGMIAARNGLALPTRIIGVVSSAAPAYADSLAAGSVVERTAETRLADGIAVRVPNADALRSITGNVERIVQVSDAAVRRAMRAFFTDTHNVAEGAGAAALAAAFQEKQEIVGRRVGIVLTGGNVDAEVFAEVLKDN